MPKDKKVCLLLPEKSELTEWVVMGVDPSLSRTGMALLNVRLNGGTSAAAWASIGSVKPESSASPVWARCKGIALYLKDALSKIAIPGNKPADNGSAALIGQPLSVTPGRVVATGTAPQSPVGLVLCMEAPTPYNDFLNAISKILHLVLLDSDLQTRFTESRVLLVNASTLRSLMGLTQRGAKNKVENIERAYQFIDRQRFPELDSDACDGVLLAMVGRHVCSILLGLADEVPANFLNVLCNSEQETKGSGRNARIVTKGILHRREYWTKYEPNSLVLLAKDASSPKKHLQRMSFEI
jgi:hypothetical protein